MAPLVHTTHHERDLTDCTLYADNTFCGIERGNVYSSNAAQLLSDAGAKVLLLRKFL